MKNNQNGKNNNKDYQKKDVFKLTPSNESKRNYKKEDNGVFVYNRELSVNELAKELKIPVSDIIKFLFIEKKMMLNLNTTLDDETIGLVCLEFGYDFRKESTSSKLDFEEMIVDRPEDLVSRPPVVTIMGHVDHGKTTLIDAIRESNLVSSEVGGISQAIGAYQKVVNGQKITFLDTPGHEAFTAMRSRGAAVTDIVVLVVAADDGVMPQTIEAIDHAKAAKVPIIVAINKIDKPGANPDKVKTELMNYDLVSEDYGGDVICIEISAKQKLNIDKLLDAILVVAELKELKANPKRRASGVVIEAKLDKGEGPKASLLVQIGTLHFQDYLVVGSTFGKIRRMMDEHHKVIKVAPPSTPVVITGLSEVPDAGETFMSFENEKEARDLASRRRMAKEEKERQLTKALSLDDLYKRIHEGETKEVNVIIKADTTGSAEAIKSSLEKLSNDEVKIHIIHSAPGAITESDIMLADVAKAIIYGFNVRPNALIRLKAESLKIDIRLHRIIYDLIEEMENAMHGMLKKEMVEKVTGQAEVRQLIHISKVGVVAGSYITNGYLKANSPIRLLRDGVITYEGKLGSLKRFKDDVKEVKEGFECGLTIENFNDLKEGDIIEGYEQVEKE